MTRALVIDPFSGAGGDMLIAALVDAGAPLEAIREQVLSMPALAGASLDAPAVKRGAFAARQLAVELPHDHTHRGLPEVTAIIDAAPVLSPAVRARAKETFTRLAETEAKLHGTTPDRVHFHEVGALDAILDVTGFYVAAEALGVERFFYTRLVVGGGGEADTAHGKVPVAAPATIELLRDHAIAFSHRTEELLTPTAAAIIATVFSALGEDRRVTPRATGYGAGTRVGAPDALPNILRVIVGDIEEAPRRLAVIRCTIDDMNPELYGHAMHSLFAAGALEVYTAPVHMKKNRPGVELTVIGEEHDAARLSEWILAHTTTLGVRVAREERVELERRQEKVETALGPANVKVARLRDGGERASPEYESCRALAEQTGRPLTEIYDLVKRAWEER
ncbi:MAG: nickel pincer cofactor biosynthesis protein LarC [Candidatus Krumholzibacteria bacterium]|nr:nickel pincer cofactor biosynthesis protein LarC [Candidatus Krumholzibacteria bacterium]